jgi:uncharacterized protein DUF1579
MADLPAGKGLPGLAGPTILEGMRYPLRLALLPLLYALILSLGACSCSDSTDPMSHFEGLVGSWSGTQKMFGDETVYQATYEVFLNKGLLEHAFASNYAGGFSGTEKLFFDADANQYVADWTDSMQAEPSRTTGLYDSEKKELTMMGKGPDFGDPEKIVNYRHFTHYGENEMNYTMSILDEKGVATEVMWIAMTKKP